MAEQQTTQNAAHRLLVIPFLLPLAHPVEDAKVVGEVGSVILRVITDARIFRPFNAATVWLKFAYQRFQQRGFTNTVGADNRQLFAHFKQQIEIFKQRTVIKTFGKRFDFQRITEQLLVLFKTNKRVLTAGRFNFIQFDFINLFRARRRLTRFRGVGAKAADERLQLGDLRFFLGVVC